MARAPVAGGGLNEALLRVPGAPERLVPAGGRVRGAREDEEQVGQPVQVDHGQRVELVLLARRAASPARLAGRSSWRREARPPPGCPPGRTKLRSSGSSALNRSQSASSRSTCDCATRRRRRARAAPTGPHRRRTARSARARARRGSFRRVPGEHDPSAALSSSTVPYAASRRSSFETRDPSPSDVCPASPPRV